MRTLLTGAKGQLARCLRDRLPEDWELIATDSTSLDITDTEAVHHMIKNFQPDAIVNAAAYTAVDKAEENAEAAFAVNATAVHNLAAAARRRTLPAFIPLFLLIMYSTAKANALTVKPTTPIHAALTVNPK